MIQDFTHEGQRYERAGEVIKRAVVWRSDCKTCGAPFDWADWWTVQPDVKPPASPSRQCKACKKLDKARCDREKAEEAKRKQAAAIQAGIDANRTTPPKPGEWSDADQAALQRLTDRKRHADPADKRRPKPRPAPRKRPAAGDQ